MTTIRVKEREPWDCKYNDESRMLLSGTVQDLLEEELPTSIEFSNSKTLNENDTSIY